MFYLYLHVAGRSITDLTTRNQEGASRWKQLTADQQLIYHEKAKALPSGSSLNKWKESRRILENLKSSVGNYIFCVPHHITFLVYLG